MSNSTLGIYLAYSSTSYRHDGSDHHVHLVRKVSWSAQSQLSPTCASYDVFYNTLAAYNLILYTSRMDVFSNTMPNGTLKPNYPRRAGRVELPGAFVVFAFCPAPLGSLRANSKMAATVRTRCASYPGCASHAIAK